MVILRGKTEDCDMAIMFGQFIILNQRPNREFTTLNQPSVPPNKKQERKLGDLDPVGGDFGDGVKDGAGVCGGDDPDGFFRGFDGSGAGFQFTEEEFVECFVAIQLGDKEFLRRNLVRRNKVWLPT
jgi:hypothetical protein